MEFDHQQLLSLLDDLMKPISTVKISNQDENEQEILTINLIFSNAYDRFLENSTSIGLTIPLDNNHPIYYRYIQIHLHLLEKLLLLEEKSFSSHTPLFSIQDESILSRSLSFVILLGLILHYDDGIYQSIENYLKNSNSSLHLLKLKTTLTYDNRFQYLNEILTLLSNWIKNHDINLYLIQRLYSHYFLELILSHLQLLYSPNLKYVSQTFLSSESLQENFDYLQTNFFKVFIQQILLLNRLISTSINSPVWLKNRCGDILTSILINKNNQGIQQLLQIILDSSSSVNERLYSSIAKILSTCPKQFKPDEYIQCIQSQLIELLHNQRYMPIICLTINQLFKKYPNIIETEVFSILFRPLFSLDNEHICQEDEFEIFVNDLDNLILMHPNEELKIYFYENYSNQLINIYLALENSLSPLKIKFFNILIEIFSLMKKENFENFLLNFKYLSLKYILNDSSKFYLINEKNTDVNWDSYCQLITKILCHINNNEKLIIDIFLYLLELLITRNEINNEFIWTEHEKQINIKQFIIMQMLKYLMEYLTEHMELFMQNIDHTIKVIQIILEKITRTCQANTKESLRTKNLVENDDDDDEIEDLSSDNEALQIIFTIASLLITHYEQLSSENKQILASLYPSLTWISKNHPNNELSQIANELSVAFVTFGAIKDVSIPEKTNVLIEEMTNERDLREETYSNAFACLYDRSLPIRAHGLILFRRLIERFDKETLSQIEENNMKLFQRFQEHLHAEDSYEYLAAINVLSVLANRYSDKILPILCNEYMNTNRKFEDKLKVGEILVKTCRILGDMSTQYASLLINTFLNASKQTDDDMYRASALSNLGQLCTVLKYSLSKNLSEILAALKSYLSIFESCEVRRASILVCELLCQSLEQSTWLTVLGSELPSFYQLINQLYKNDKDDIVRLHAQIALEALNQICRDFLQPPVILEKKIRILS